MTPKDLIKLEEVAMFILALYGLTLIGVDWWWYLVLLLGPDISMLGYIAGNKTGAFFYNLFHLKAVAILVFAAGLFLPDTLLLVIGIILFGHSSMDRVFGYGLKTGQGFKYTHLGIIGKK